MHEESIIDPLTRYILHTVYLLCIVCTENYSSHTEFALYPIQILWFSYILLFVRYIHITVIIAYILLIGYLQSKYNVWGSILESSFNLINTTTRLSCTHTDVGLSVWMDTLDSGRCIFPIGEAHQCCPAVIILALVGNIRSRKYSVTSGGHVIWMIHGSDLCKFQMDHGSGDPWIRMDQWIIHGSVRFMIRTNTAYHIIIDPPHHITAAYHRC